MKRTHVRVVFFSTAFVVGFALVLVLYNSAVEVRHPEMLVNFPLLLAVLFLGGGFIVALLAWYVDLEMRERFSLYFKTKGVPELSKWKIRMLFVAPVSRVLVELAKALEIADSDEKKHLSAVETAEENIDLAAAVDTATELDKKYKAAEKAFQRAVGAARYFGFAKSKSYKDYLVGTRAPVTAPRRIA